jgi:ribosomal-protein-alanine N-acetyltransferase
MIDEKKRDDVFIHFPTIKTNRCELIKIEEKHFPDIFALLSNDSVTQYLEGIETFTELEEVRSFISVFNQAYHNRFAILWGIRLKNTTQIIGLISIYEIEKEVKANLFYALLPSFWRKGVMTECVRKVTRFGFNKLLLSILETDVDNLNVASQSLLLNVGYNISVH